jgi:hypothetical protein
MKEHHYIESEIHMLNSVADQLDALLWRYMDHPDQMSEDQLCNGIMAVQSHLELRLEKLFDTYKQVYQLDEYAPPKVIAEREKKLAKIFKQRKKNAAKL